MLGDSPMVTGTWYNPKTGHSFTAKDTYFEDNNMYVLTTDGQRIDGNMLSQYVQSNRPMDDKRDFAKPQPAAAVLPPEVQAAIVPATPQDKLVEGLAPAITEADAQFMTEEDRALLAGAKIPDGSPFTQGLGNIHKPEDEDTLLVRRMLKRAEAPTVNCSIQWNNFPRKQMDMLDTMGVDYDKIAEFYMKDIDVKAIQKIIKSAIVDAITKYLECEADANEANASIAVEKKTPIPEAIAFELPIIKEQTVEAPIENELELEKPIGAKKCVKKSTSKNVAKKPIKKQVKKEVKKV